MKLTSKVASVLIAMSALTIPAHAGDREEKAEVHRLFGKLHGYLARHESKKKESKYFFDVDTLSDISRKGVGLPTEEAFDAVQKELIARYGADHIASGRHWIFNAAGNVLGELTLLYCSPTEYLIFFGSPTGTGGFSGRYPHAEFFDFMFLGQMSTYRAGETTATITNPGQYAHLERGVGKGYTITPGSFMLEYGRGNILSAFDFGIISPARYNTRDWKSAREQIIDCGKLALHEMFGKGSKESAEWESLQ